MANKYSPSYIHLYKIGELKSITKQLWQLFSPCRLCPRECGANRSVGEKGLCGSDDKLKIAGYMLHRGEEPPISGTRGSGTIFFSNCPLKCVFCQNYNFSQCGEGEDYSISDLAKMMLELQKMGAHNINLVTPEHYIPHIISALDIAVSNGLSIPIVYNSSGYARVEVLRLLEGIFDIYLPDIKYSSRYWSSRLSSVTDYPKTSRAAVLEMHRQVSDYIFDSKTGVILRGLIIRHLVLPEDASGSFSTLSWIRENLGKEVFISLMSQYMPVFRSRQFEEINRRITVEEYKRVQNWAISLGLEKGWWQEGYGLDSLAGERIREEFFR